MRRCMRCMQEYDDQLLKCPHCDYSVGDQQHQKEQYPDTLPAESILMGRYILGALHQHDDYSNLYFAWDALLEKEVFLREYLPLEICNRPEGKDELVFSQKYGINSFEYGRTAFEEEADRLNRNQDIEGIVPVFRYFQEKGTTFLVLEYVYHDTLEEILKSGQTIPLEMAENLLRCLCRSIDEMHRRGICHWNLTPSCIFVDEDWNSQLSGFGQAKMLLNAFLAQDVFYGSLYTAPELSAGNSADGRADLYALGLIGKEVLQLTEDLPFRKRSQIKKVLNRLSNANPKKRPDNTAELTELLSVHYET